MSNPNYSTFLNRLDRTPEPATGGDDLLKAFGLTEAYEELCLKPIPEMLADTSYFDSIPGDTEIRRGDGMELGQLLDDIRRPREDYPVIKPIPFETLRRAFNFRETGPVYLPEDQKGRPVANAAPTAREADGKGKGDAAKKKHRGNLEEKNEMVQQTTEGYEIYTSDGEENEDQTEDMEESEHGNEDFGSEGNEGEEDSESDEVERENQDAVEIENKHKPRLLLKLKYAASSTQHPSSQAADTVRRRMWSQEEDNVLLQGLADGKTIKEIVATLESRTASAARSRYKLLQKFGQS